MTGTSFFAEAKHLVPSPDSATYNLYNSPAPALAANGAATLSMLGFSPVHPQPADTADFQTANGSVDNVTNNTTPSARTAFELGVNATSMQKWGAQKKRSVRFNDVPKVCNYVPTPISSAANSPHPPKFWCGEEDVVMADADTVASPFTSAAFGELPRWTPFSFLPANLVGMDSNSSFAPAAADTVPFTLGHRHSNGPLLFSEGAHKPRTPPSAGSTRCRLRQVGRVPTSRDRLNRTMAMFNISAGGDIPTVPMANGSIGVQCDFSMIYETEEHANKENIFNIDILGDASKLPENKRVFVDTILGGAALPRPSSNKRSRDAYAYAYASLKIRDEVKIEKAGKKEEQAPKRARRGKGPVAADAAAAPAALALAAAAAAAAAQPAGEWGGRLRTRKSRA